MTRFNKIPTLILQERNSFRSMPRATTVQSSASLPALNCSLAHSDYCIDIADAGHEPQAEESFQKQPNPKPYIPSSVLAVPLTYRQLHTFKERARKRIFRPAKRHHEYVLQANQTAR